jgi:hypothetical protein
MMRSPPIRKLLTALLCLVGLLAWPRPAHAIPVLDKEVIIHTGTQMIERFGDWYMQAREWRVESMKRAQTMIDRTRVATSTREKFESMAQGELGRLGQAIPDWREYSNHCSISKDGTSICDAGEVLQGKYEAVIVNNFVAYRDSVFSRWDQVEDSLNVLIGGQVGRGSDHMDRMFRTAVGDQRKTTLQYRRTLHQPYIIAQARTGNALEQSAENLQAQIDSILAMEAQGEISSGRAAQLNASLAYLEALINLKIATARIETMQMRALQVMQDIDHTRSGTQAVHQGAARW